MAFLEDLRIRPLTSSEILGFYLRHPFAAVFSIPTDVHSVKDETLGGWVVMIPSGSISGILPGGGQYLLVLSNLDPGIQSNWDRIVEALSNATVQTVKNVANVIPNTLNYVAWILAILVVLALMNSGLISFRSR